MDTDAETPALPDRHWSGVAKSERFELVLRYDLKVYQAETVSVPLRRTKRGAPECRECMIARVVRRGENFFACGAHEHLPTCHGCGGGQIVQPLVGSLWVPHTCRVL